MTETRQRKRPQTAAQKPTSVSNGQDDASKRIAEIRARRAERGPTDINVSNQKLSVAEDRKDPRFTYRWALDTGSRVHDLKARDWDIAPASTTEGDLRDVGIGSVPERMGNTRTVTKPERHVLMRKPKEFYQEDKAREQAQIDSQEEVIRKTGDVKNPQGLSGPGSYIPTSGMKIEHGR